jgi:hypothetical protein
MHGGVFLCLCAFAKNLPLVGPHGQKSHHIGTAHVARMPHAPLFGGSQDEKTSPIQVSLFILEAIVQVSNAFSNLVQKTLGYQRRCAGEFVDCLYLVIRTVCEGSYMMSKSFSAQEQTRYPTCGGHIW